MINWLRKLRGLPPRPCHVGYKAVPSHERYRLRQGMAVCRKCGEMHLTKPRLTDLGIEMVIGKR